MENSSGSDSGGMECDQNVDDGVSSVASLERYRKKHRPVTNKSFVSEEENHLQMAKPLPPCRPQLSLQVTVVEVQILPDVQQKIVL